MIKENNIAASITNPIKATLVPLRTNFNANGSVRRRTSVYLDLFHWLMGKNSGNHNGVCRYIQANSGERKTTSVIYIRPQQTSMKTRSQKKGRTWCWLWSKFHNKQIAIIVL